MTYYYKMVCAKTLSPAQWVVRTACPPSEHPMKIAALMRGESAMPGIEVRRMGGDPVCRE